MANMANTSDDTTHIRMHISTRDRLNRVCAALLLRGVKLNQIDAIDIAVALLESREDDVVASLFAQAGEVGEGSKSRKRKTNKHRL